MGIVLDYTLPQNALGRVYPVLTVAKPIKRGKEKSAGPFRATLRVFK